MPAPRVFVAIASAMALVAGAAIAQTPPRETACDASPVVVRGADDDDARGICLGARDALDFLIGYGLLAPGRVQVSVAAGMPARYDPRAAGVYDPRSATVHLLDYPSFRRFGSWLGQPIDRAMYRSIAAHEIAHAIATLNFAMPMPGVLAREYVAYVTEFATMDPAFRARALATYPQAGFAHIDEMNELAYGLDPMAFGVGAWRHWEGLADRAAFLNALLLGVVLSEPMSSYRSAPAPR